MMSDVPAPPQDKGSAWWQRESKRELTKLECGLLGALSATIVLMLIVALGLQLSILALSIQLT